MLINNTENRHHTIPPPHTMGRGAPAGAPRLSPIVLDTGINKVDDAAWAEAEKIPAIQAALKSGALEIVKTKSGRPVEELSDLKPAEAIKIVAETESQELLADWRQEAKGAVKVAIDDKVEALRSPKKNKR